MPISYRVDEELGIFIVTLRGALTDEELLETTKRMIDDPAKRPGLHELVDAQDVQLREASSSAVRQVAELFAAGPRPEKGVRVAFVAPADAAFGVARMYEALRQQSAAEFRVFRAMDEALAWLGSD